MSRYLGYEPCTSKEQVIRYLTENYVDKDGDAMPRMVALDLITAGEAQVTKGIEVFSSNVYYLGDEAVRDHGEGHWTELPEPGESEGEDEL